MQKNETGPLSLHYIQKLTQKGLGLNVDNDILDLAPNIKATKAKINEQGYIKLKASEKS